MYDLVQELVFIAFYLAAMSGLIFVLAHLETTLDEQAGAWRHDRHGVGVPPRFPHRAGHLLAP